MRKQPAFFGYVLASAFLLAVSACGETSTTSTPATTAAPSASVSSVPDFSKLGFPTILGSKDLTPGRDDTVVAGPYVFQIPANAFAGPVKFEVLGGDPAAYNSKLPSGQTSVLAFALRVTDKNTNQLIAKFQNPITVIASDKSITAESLYCNVSTDGTVVLNPGGTAKAGELDHPESGTTVAWVITAPSSAAGGTSTGGGTTVPGPTSTPPSGGYGY
ncbi:MAG: hypothetical protein M1455_10345 [Actinobacteria bacterium]|nr:hypothetical protein [Actinomycetota bacterium]